VKHLKKQPEVFQQKHYVTKHLVIPVFFNEPPIDLANWSEQPGIGRVIGVKSVLYSDGSSRRYYKVEAPKKLQQTPREKRVKHKS